MNFMSALYFLLWIGILLIVGFLQNASPQFVEKLLQENGLIESLSAIAWFVAAGVLAVFSYVRRWHRGFAVTYLLLALAFRELDFHKRFTTMGILKIKFYLNSTVPVLEKIMAGLVLGFLLLMVWFFVKDRIGWFFRRLRNREGPTVALAVFFPLLGSSKILDRLPNALQEAGITFPIAPAGLMRIIEETMELGLPLMMIIIIFHWARKTSWISTWDK
jgi:hypothetical protein